MKHTLHFVVSSKLYKAVKFIAQYNFFLLSKLVGGHVCFVCARFMGFLSSFILSNMKFWKGDLHLLFKVFARKYFMQLRINGNCKLIPDHKYIQTGIGESGLS